MICLNSRTCRLATLTVASCLWATPALVHPHVFAEATLNVSVNTDGTVGKLAHKWRFDDVFSSTVLFEFDKDTDGKISANEQAEIENTIIQSIAEYDYFEAVQRNGKDVKMAKPAKLNVAFEETTLVISFENAPQETMPVQGKVTFGVFDPTFYTAIDFVEDTDLKVAGLPAACKTAVVRPDPEQAIAQNQQTLTEAFFNEPTGNDLTKIMATRIEVTC